MSNEATATDWDAVKPALYEAAKGHWFELDSLFNERDDLLAEAGRLREALKRIEECAHGIMPIYRDMDHLRGIVIGLNDARWTRLYAILGEARAALSGKGTT